MTLEISEVLLAGYTGRDQHSVREHIRELQALGVAPPPRVPMVYTVEASLLTTGAEIRVHTTQTSGEVEFVLVPSSDGLLIGVGSDHTDRKHEAIDVAESKRLCAKVVSREVWPYDEIKDHWDQLEISSWVTPNEDRRLYQQGTLAAFLPVDDIMREVRAAGHADLEGRAVFGGTLAAPGGFVYGDRFECRLHDRVLNRSLSCAYSVRVDT